MQLSRKTLVTEDGESFLQRQLKPVPTGDAIASPIVEILMGDHTFNPFQFGVSCRFGIRQH